MSSIKAIGDELTGLKASLLEVCYFLDFVAGKIAILSSDIEWCIQIATPAKSVSFMKRAAETRFKAASEEGLSDDLCEPTRIIGIGKSSKMNANAAAV